MINKEFAHLHVHTEYSLLDGANKIKKLISRTKELGMDSIAITDHGNMFGVIQFYKAAKAEGIKPIIGCEVYVAMNSRHEKEAKDKKQYHLVLLAENNIGYKNLIKIVSDAYVNGFYYKPRTDIEFLKEHSEGIIALSACLGGAVAQKLLMDDFKAAYDTASLYNGIFGKGNYYLEIQDHGLAEQRNVNKGIIEIAKQLNIPLVCTNDVHYLYKSDAEMHDVLLCIQTGSTVNEEKRMKYPTKEFYLKSPDEMWEIFDYCPEALENTISIKERCNVEISFGEQHLPEYTDVPKGMSKEDYLRELIEKGLNARYGEINDSIRSRYEYELGIITQMDYVDYFLIVWDFIHFAKTNDIIVGPGRGSAAGSIISYALEIIDIDPLKYGLLFERFLNPERVSMPDIDTDICYERRDEVIQYVINKYGADKVAQIVTFGTMAARGAIRDVGRAMDIDYGKVDKIAKLVPMEIGMTISRAISVSDSLKENYESDEEVKALIDTAMELEGLPRHTSTHAAGVIVTKEAVTEYVPLVRNGDLIATQFNMTELEELGLLKMDFLGLRTLTVIRDSLNIIEKTRGVKVDFSTMEMDDPEVFELFAKAETLGIFQFESSGMRSFLKELKPSVFEDLVAANSLFRPGPMNQIPTFIESKHDPTKIKYLHPKLAPILKVTYGCIVYQEQVMQIVRDIGGYTFGQADLVRRAMSKKKMDVMEEERKNFIHGKLDENGSVIIPGAIKNGVDEVSANKIYDLMIDFANYAFNKSHSAAYAVVAYRTAWLKHYYTVDFMAALISSIMGNSSQVSLYIQECKRLGIEVLSPDISISYGKFTVQDDKIRFGLYAVKNVGVNIVDTIIQARKTNGKFNSFSDFISKIGKINPAVINKRAIESLIKAGAMDSFGVNRTQLLAVYERVINSFNEGRKKNLAGQYSLFKSSEDNLFDDIYPNIDEFPKNILLDMEKEILGIYVSGHPLDPYREALNRNSKNLTIELNSIGDDEDLSGLRDGSYVSLGGMIISKKNLTTKNNKSMAFIAIEDFYGSVECVVFPKIYAAYYDLLLMDKVVLVKGRLSWSEVEGAKILVDRIFELKPDNENSREEYRSENKPSSTVKLYLRYNSISSEVKIDSIVEILDKYKGKIPVVIYDEASKKVMRADQNLWVSESMILIEELKKILGRDSVILR